jgi:hypothetical protein
MRAFTTPAVKTPGESVDVPAKDTNESALLKRCYMFYTQQGAWPNRGAALAQVRRQHPPPPATVPRDQGSLTELAPQAAGTASRQQLSTQTEGQSALQRQPTSAPELVLLPDSFRRTPAGADCLFA